MWPPGAGPVPPAPDRLRNCASTRAPSSHAADDRRANEYRLQLPGRRARREIGSGFEFVNAAVDLPAVGVALHRDIHQPEALLGGMRDLVAPAGSRPRRCRRSACAGRIPRRASSRFSACSSFSMVVLSPPGITRPSISSSSAALAHLHRLRAGALQRLAVRLEIALQRQHPDPLHHLPASGLQQLGFLQLGNVDPRHRRCPALRWLPAAWPDR